MHAMKKKNAGAKTARVLIRKARMADVEPIFALISVFSKQESMLARSRSELLREAARLYVERQRRWEDVFQLGDKVSEKLGLREADLARELKAVRR